MDQRRPRHSFKSGLHKLSKKTERIFPLQLAGSGYSENPFGKTFTRFGLIPETEFSPLDGRPERLLGSIIGWLDAFMGEENEQMWPVVEGSFRSSAHFPVGTALILETVPFHSCPHERRGINELLAVDAAFAEGVPATQDVPDLFEHVLRKHIGIRTATAVFEGFELADQMSPAQLSDSVLVVAAVGRVVVRGDHAAESFAQHGSENLGSAAYRYGEVNGQGRDEHPKVSTVAFALPAGLVNVEVAGVAKGLLHFLGDGLKLGADPIDAIAHGSQAKAQAEEGVEDFHDASSANSMDRGEIGNGTMHSRPELSLWHFRRKNRSRSVATAAFELMAPMLIHDGPDLRQLKGLIALGFG